MQEPETCGRTNIGSAHPSSAPRRKRWSHLPCGSCRPPLIPHCMIRRADMKIQPYRRVNLFLRSVTATGSTTKTPAHMAEGIVAAASAWTDLNTNVALTVSTVYTKAVWIHRLQISSLPSEIPSPCSGHVDRNWIVGDAAQARALAETTNCSVWGFLSCRVEREDLDG